MPAEAPPADTEQAEENAAAVLPESMIGQGGQDEAQTATAIFEAADPNMVTEAADPNNASEQ